MMQGGGGVGGGAIVHVGGGGGEGDGDGRRNNDDPNREMIKHQPNKQPQQPQKCPRCDSLNTKFCYYNNYSLTQPRYFCKNCRRYWTQGGTLRNVPVGGGCRKGKRPKIVPAAGSSSSAGASAGTVTASTNAANTLASTAINPPPLLAPFGFGSYNYAAGGSGGGGFLSSLAAVQSFTHPGAVGGGVGTSSFSNLGLLMHGNFNTNMNPPPPHTLPPNFGSHQNQPKTRQFYSLSAGDQPQPEQQQQQQQNPQLINWHLQHQGLMLVPDTSLWSISTTATAAANTATAGAANGTDNVNVGSSGGHQWNNNDDRLPGYGPPQ